MSSSGRSPDVVVRVPYSGRPRRGRAPTQTLLFLGSTPGIMPTVAGNARQFALYVEQTVQFVQRPVWNPADPGRIK